MMEEIVFIGFGIEIIRRNGRLFIRYDSGELVSKILEDEITETEMSKAQKSERDAYEVLLECERRRMNEK